MTRALLMAIVLSLSMVGLASAGVPPSGPEFPVNARTKNSQAIPKVAMSGAGDFTVVWEDFGQDGSLLGVFGRQFDSSGIPIGAEFQVNTFTTDGQGRPVIGMNGAGDFVVVWNSIQQDGSLMGAFGQLFDSGGSPVGAEFQVNTHTAHHQRFPAAAMNGAGDFVIVWQSYQQDGSLYGVFGQMFDSGGSPVGAEFRVNSYTSGTQSDPTIAMNEAGEFVVAWVSGNQVISGFDVFGQVFDSGGSPVGAEFRVNTYTTSSQGFPEVSMSASGEFVVVWASRVQDGSLYGVFGQLFDSGGGPVGAEFRVNTYTPHYQSSPEVSMNASGEFVVVWESYDQDGSGFGVFGRYFDSGGSPVGGEFQVNSYITSDQGFPAVAMNTAGEFVVVWESYGQDGSKEGIYGKLYADCTVEQCDGIDNDCDGLTDEMGICTGGFYITSPLDGATLDCSDPALNRPTFTWETGGYDRFKVFIWASSGFNKASRVTSGKKKITTGSWMPNKKKWKNACRKAVGQAADPNSPVMFIAVRGVDRDLPKSDSLRVLFSSIVHVNVQP